MQNTCFRLTVVVCVCVCGGDGGGRRSGGGGSGGFQMMATTLVDPEQLALRASLSCGVVEWAWVVKGWRGGSTTVVV